MSIGQITKPIMSSKTMQPRVLQIFTCVALILRQKFSDLGSIIVHKAASEMLQRLVMPEIWFRVSSQQQADPRQFEASI